MVNLAQSLISFNCEMLFRLLKVNLPVFYNYTLQVLMFLETFSFIDYSKLLRTVLRCHTSLCVDRSKTFDKLYVQKEQTPIVDTSRCPLSNLKFSPIRRTRDLMFILCNYIIPRYPITGLIPNSQMLSPNFFRRHFTTPLLERSDLSDDSYSW